MRSLCVWLCLYALLSLCTADDCPARCDCTFNDIRYVNCESRALHAVPKNISQETRALYLTSNNIREISSDDFKNLKNLISLELDNNKITSLDKDVFSGLSELQMLHLSSNSIKEISSDVFKNLTRLGVLSLRNNTITDVDKDAFRGLLELQYLHLSFNNIKEISSDHFKSLKRLITLNLENNKITALYKDVFHGLSELQTLDLDNNQITIIEDGVFDGLINLQYLYLENNKIRQLGKGTFQGLPKLKDFHIHGNPLACDCKMKSIEDMLQVPMNNRESVTCKSPRSMFGKHISAILESTTCSNPSFSAQPQDTKFNIGDTTVLNCSATGLPPPDIYWTKDALPLRFSSKIKVSESGSLTISGTRDDNAGTYSCIAVNAEGQVTSAEAKLRVQG